MTEPYEEGFFKTADGLRVHYRNYPPSGVETGVPVLCLHGLTRNLRDFEELAPRISGLGRRVITASQRGRGLSDPDPVVERYNPGVYAADMLALLDRLGIGRAAFIGTSMGGLMTMIAAALAPDRIAAAVLNDVGPEIDPAGLERIRGYVGGAPSLANWAEAAARCRSINGIAFPDERDDAYWIGFARRIFREDAGGRLVLDYDAAISRSVAPGSATTADLWPLFEALKPIPTLVVRGELTDILMPSTVAEMQRRKPDLVVAAVPRVGHAPFLTEPAAWEALRAFLSAN
jgi:pimeloyl-ACP methyl ester carboxylesterase